jgi:hypothetical protein
VKEEKTTLWEHYQSNAFRVLAREIDEHTIA